MESPCHFPLDDSVSKNFSGLTQEFVPKQMFPENDFGGVSAHLPSATARLSASRLVTIETVPDRFCQFRSLIRLLEEVHTVHEN